MPALSTFRCAAVLAALVSLSACGGGVDDKFAPPCPVPSIPRDSNEISRFRGAGRDLTDSVLDGRITALNGKCTKDGPDAVVATVTVGMELTRGPAFTGRTADIAYYVAVSEGDRMIDKRVFPLRPEFPANTDRVRLSGDDVELRFPIGSGKTAAAYRISVGFQLTAVELEENRRRGVRR